MKIEDFLIGIGLFSVVAVILLAATVNMASNFQDMGITVAINDNSSAAFNKAAQINNISQEMQSKLIDNPTGTGITSFVTGAYAAVITSFKALTISADLTTDVVSLFGLPPELSMFLISAVIISIVMMLVYLIFAGSSN